MERQNEAKELPQKAGPLAADIKSLRLAGYCISRGAPHIQIPNAREWLHAAAASICADRGERFVWESDYEAVAQWLEDNQRKSLFIMGNCGNGKTLMSDAIAVVFYRVLRKVCDKVAAVEVTTAKQLQNILGSWALVVDDVGTEGEIVDYGLRKNMVAEVVDAIERKGGLAIITTNLDRETLLKKYGDRTIDRIAGNFKRCQFKAPSKRKKEGG